MREKKQIMLKGESDFRKGERGREREREIEREGIKTLGLEVRRRCFVLLSPQLSGVPEV